MYFPYRHPSARRESLSTFWSQYSAFPGADRLHRPKPENLFPFYTQLAGNRTTAKVFPLAAELHNEGEPL